ncbi:serine hydrolase [Selenomonas ruminantium]|uniref:serine hydrolase n=1 Tax=Selenomonas ruminantium TaxID=971 RepID=UPI001568941E|nr:serine hydrolase [Selenomonas ruminantium]
MNVKRMITFFSVLVVLEAGGMASAALWQQQEGGIAAQAAENRAVKNVQHAPKAVDEEELTAQTVQIIGDTKNQLAVYFLRPDREIEPFIYHSQQMAPASMIKLFVMAKTMQDVHDGKLSLDEKITIKKNDAVGGAGVTTWYNAGEQRTIEQLMTVMITDSDNTATNILIDRLGMQNINRYLQQQGFRDTVLVYKMMMGRKGKKKNLSSVRDIGSFFSRLYYHQLVGEQEDKLMLAILRQQHDKECFPAALPDYEIAHKTGEVNDVYVDGGIFFGQQEDFVLVILSNGKAGRSDAIEKMQNLARYYAGTLQE